MNNRFIYFLISLTVSLSIKTTKKTTLKTQKITYGNEITLNKTIVMLWMKDIHLK